MKTTPTNLDREAGRLFVVTSGMRWWTDSLIGGGLWFIWNPARGYAPHHPDAIDTDDPATVGCMLAQVRDAACQPCLHVVAGEPDLDGSVWWSVPRRFAGRSALSRTEGAALVAAMRAIREGAL